MPIVAWLRPGLLGAVVQRPSRRTAPVGRGPRGSAVARRLAIALPFGRLLQHLRCTLVTFPDGRARPQPVGCHGTLSAMQSPRRPAITLSTTTVRVPTVGFPRALERQIADIMTRTSPRRDGIAADRGIVSVLFVRIDGYIGLCESLEPPRIGSILALYGEAVSDSVGIYAGTVQTSLSDVLVATWNAAYPQPDHALLAVSAAIDMVERMDDLNLRLGPEVPPIRYALGVNTGDALILRTGNRRSDHEVIGDSVNIAGLLCGEASGGCILIGEGTHISTHGDLIVRDAGVLPLPGRQEPVQAYAVEGRVTRGSEP